jgi:hypothetical protein
VEAMEVHVCIRGGGTAGERRCRTASRDSVRHHIGATHKWGERLQRSPIRCPAGGGLALASSGTRRALDWNS